MECGRRKTLWKSNRLLNIQSTFWGIFGGNCFQPLHVVYTTPHKRHVTLVQGLELLNWISHRKWTASGKIWYCVDAEESFHMAILRRLRFSRITPKTRNVTFHFNAYCGRLRADEAAGDRGGDRSSFPVYRGQEGIVVAWSQVRYVRFFKTTCVSKCGRRDAKERGEGSKRGMHVTDQLLAAHLRPWCPSRVVPRDLK